MEAVSKGFSVLKHVARGYLDPMGKGGKRARLNSEVDNQRKFSDEYLHLSTPVLMRNELAEAPPKRA